MKFDIIFSDLRDNLSKEDEKGLILLFDYAFRDLDEYSDIKSITIKEKLFLAVHFKHQKKPVLRPLFGAIFGQLLPILIEDFKYIVKHNKTYYLDPNSNINNSRYSINALYKFYSIYNLIPVKHMLEMHNFIIGDILEKEIEEEIKYKQIAKLAT